MAALVMRRDLAVYREKERAGSEAVVKESSATLTDQKISASTRTPEADALATTEEAPPEEDIFMQDEPQEPAPDFADTEQVPAPAQTKVDNQETSSDVKSSPKDAKQDPVAEISGAGEVGAASQNGGLSIETATAQEDSKSGQDQGEDRAPDTATGDMDSLFNDPTSADDGAAANAFDFDQNNSGELDFGSFGAGFDSSGADNDNISSLLPGLEDYVNPQTNPADDMMDFNSFFDTGNDGQNSGMDQQGSGEQRDTTFDDLMDLANFEGMEGDDNNNNSNNNNADLDFEALFN